MPRHEPESFGPGGLTVESGGFSSGGTIPARFTCDGADLSPPLRWSGAPTETKSFALICEDPDAPRGLFVHWVLYNLPAEALELNEGVPPLARMPSGARQGVNDFPKIGWGGPCPPPGAPHRYRFLVFALDTLLNLADDVDRVGLLDAMDGHILTHGTLTGTYGR